MAYEPRTRTPRLTVAAAGLAALLAHAAAAGENPCLGSKVRAVGKKAKAKLACHAKVAAKGTVVDASCLAKAEAKYARSFARAGECSGDQAVCEARVDECVTAVLATLPAAGPSRCTAAKRKAAGQLAAGEFDCYARAARKGEPVDDVPGGCLARAEAKFSAAFARAELGAPCSGDAPDVEQAVATACIDKVVKTTGGMVTDLCPACTCNPIPPLPLKLKFTSGSPAIGLGACGVVTDDLGNPVVQLDCGALYLGGGGGTIPLPSPLPDQSGAVTQIVACEGSTLELAATTAAQTGSHRTCSAAGVADPDYPACVGGSRNALPCRTNVECPGSGTCTGTMPGCLFGAPQAVVNNLFAAGSTCIVSRITQSLTGHADCFTNVSTTSLALAADLYLEGDLLDGSTPDRPLVPGIQPCPICDAATHVCRGGPRHGMACAPANSAALGSAYPTSHDCPPPPGALGSAYLTTLHLPLTLTSDPTGSVPAAHKVAKQMNGQEVFCGFCTNLAGTVFKNPPVPCTANADCAGVTGCGPFPCTACKQRTSGAFGAASANPGSEHEITMFGSPPQGSLADLAPHATTQVGTFCIPPAFNATVDANVDLPGPGAISIPGQVQVMF